ncbi:hypothetical protein ACFWXH_22525 [Mesorhizobium sp. NPDC059054]|uniref:hypothetical protein n=1 Tax=Mesorhizobium sp. NPDC059054 TaxID=3346711 RepID=UPI0036C6FE63
MSHISSRLLLLASVVALVPVADGALAAERHARKAAHAIAVPDNSMARAIFNQAEGVEQGIRYAAQLNLIDAAKAGSLASEARSIRGQAARGDGSRELLARLSDVSQSLRVATGEGWRIGGGGDGGYYPAGYGSNFPNR